MDIHISAVLCCVVLTEPVVEFLTVHIYTCSQSCWPPDIEFVEEFTIVEYDRDSSLIDEALSRVATSFATTGLQGPSLTKL